MLIKRLRNSSYLLVYHLFTTKHTKVIILSEVKCLRKNKKSVLRVTKPSTDCKGLPLTSSLLQADVREGRVCLPEQTVEQKLKKAE